MFVMVRRVGVQLRTRSIAAWLGEMPIKKKIGRNDAEWNRLRENLEKAAQGWP
jgi:hypothetical protein